MINIGYIAGKVLNDIDLKFVYDGNRKSISRKHTSVTELIIELGNKNIVYAKAYDEVADYIYRKIEKGYTVILYGKIRYEYFEVIQVLSIMEIWYQLK